jgi:small multidrug resistance pump
MKGYLFLILTVILETLAIILMKLAHGGTNKMYLTLAIICFSATFFSLTTALKYLPMGYTNAIWAGSSTVLVCLIGFLFFEEKLSIKEIFFLCCIIVGLVGLNFYGKGK